MGWRDWFGAGKAESTADLIATNDATRPVVATSAPPSAQSPSDPLPQIEALLRTNNKLQAIKVYLDHYGVGLAEAKDAVDAIARGETRATADGQPAPTSDTVQDLVNRGLYIDAIKEYRALHGVGLAEAKDAVDRLRG